MNDDQALRLLEAGLEHDDPRLAALLTGSADPRRSRRAWLLVLVPGLSALALLPLTAAIGVASLLLVLASPLIVCWACTPSRGPQHPPIG
ncbi:MAG: hypothetical protein JWQ99_2203 [Blastococcus sp.]|jgi:hypothetical protein|nr:hypothetical protein [Blastococcus sp.]